MATIAAGNLVFQVAGQDFGKANDHSGTGQPLASLEQPAWLLPYLDVVWPARDSDIDWPRPHRLTVDDMITFSNWPDVVIVEYG